MRKLLVSCIILGLLLSAMGGFAAVKSKTSCAAKAKTKCVSKAMHKAKTKRARAKCVRTAKHRAATQCGSKAKKAAKKPAPVEKKAE